MTKPLQSSRHALAIVVLSILFLAATARAIAPWSLFINTNNLIVVTDLHYGAISNGIFTNTTAFQSAINDAATGALTNGLRGGMVEVPPGVFLCGPLTMKSNVRLQLDAGAVIRLLPYGSWPGSPYTGTVSPLINGSGLTNIAVTGMGMFDGQGSPWWPFYKSINRPLILSLQPCSKVLLQDFTSSNPPVAHIALKGNGGNINIIGVHLLAPDSSDPVNPSHNTDGVDLAETNAVIQDCVISTGDDNIAMGSSGSLSKEILVTNCFFGFGHGVSIGSYTSSGVSNLLVIDCTFSNTGNGIKIKSSRDRGGVVQGLNYFNIQMTNVTWPIQLYSYYEYGLGTLETVTPQFAALVGTNTPPGSSPPIYRNITISNVTANILNGQPPLMLWGLPDYPISNIVFKAVHLNSSSTSVSGIYNVTNLQFIDCSFTEPNGVKAFQCWHAEMTFTNGSSVGSPFLFGGLTTNGIGSTLSFFNQLPTVSNTNVIGGGAVTINDSICTINNSLALTTATPLSYVVGTNPAALAVKGNLALGGIVNVSAGPGFTNGSYTLMTYTGGLSGVMPVLGTAPSGYACSLSAATTLQINLVVTPPPPGIPTNLTAIATNMLINLNWYASSNAASYNLQRSTTNGGPYSLLANLMVTNFSDSVVMPGQVCYYVVTATNSGGESGLSVQSSAAPLPSNVSTNLSFQDSDNQLQVSWPADHLGWRLQIQTNSPNEGLGSNWVTIPDSTNATVANIPVDPANGSVFFRLIYP